LFFILLYLISFAENKEGELSGLSDNSPQLRALASWTVSIQLLCMCIDNLLSLIF